MHSPDISKLDFDTLPLTVRHDILRLRSDLSWARFMTAYWRSAALNESKGFNPAQPRIPSGQHEGGQWAGSSPSPLSPEPTRTFQTVVRDETGQETWHHHIDTFTADGRLSEQFAANRDGSTVRSEFKVSGEGGWDERHIVRLADGSLVSFVNRGTQQTVFAGDAATSLAVPLSQMDFAAGLDAQVELAKGPIMLPDATKLLPNVDTLKRWGDAARTLFMWRSSQNTPDKTAVIDITAHEFEAGNEPGDPARWVGTLDRQQTELVCPRYPEVQVRTDVAAASVKSMRSSLSASRYGTAVHKALEPDITLLADPNLKAEQSFIKSKDEGYGAAGSIRVDVLERSPNDTVCVYDVKTGKAKLTRLRMQEIANEVLHAFRGPKRTLLVEVRPR